MQDGQTARWFSSTMALMLESCAYDSHIWGLSVWVLYRHSVFLQLFRYMHITLISNSNFVV